MVYSGKIQDMQHALVVAIDLRWDNARKGEFRLKILLKVKLEYGK